MILLLYNLLYPALMLPAKQAQVVESIVQHGKFISKCAAIGLLNLLKDRIIGPPNSRQHLVGVHLQHGNLVESFPMRRVGRGVSRHMNHLGERGSPQNTRRAWLVL